MKDCEIKFEEDFFISSLEDATAIKALLSATSLETLQLENFIFRGDQVAAEIVCNAIRDSHVELLDILNWDIPEEFSEAFANAIAAASCLISLKVTADRADIESLLPLLNTLGPALLGASSTLQSLSLQIGDDDAIYHCLEKILPHARLWKITSLSLLVEEWSNDFDQVLAEYVKNTPCLKKLDLVLRDMYQDDVEDKKITVVSSPALLEAVRSGSGTLDYLSVNDGYKHNADHTWCRELAHYVSGDRLRRLCTASFQQTMDSNAVAQVLDELDASVLFEILVQDEFHLQVL